ncbi:MAG: hypothetical protein FWH19_03065 [Treponema sp.]|nr:hypothetical protein [Treponema sp.]
MKKIKFILLVICSFLTVNLYAQDGRTIPLGLVLNAAEHAEDGFWRPDWPLDLPPDAFSLLEGEALRIAIEWEGRVLELRLGTGGRPELFPFMLNGRTAQLSLLYSELSEITEMLVTFPFDDETWEIEILEHRDSLPYLARVYSNNTWFFAYFTRTAHEILEAWYDADGTYLNAISYSLIEIAGKQKIRAARDFSNPHSTVEYHYDSRGFVTESSGPGGLYRVLYFRQDLPRYWERSGTEGGTGSFILHWDANGLLTRISNAEEGENTAEFLDWRFEYSLDERGNWIERREIRMIRQEGLLIPAPGNSFRRVLEYRE